MRVDSKSSPSGARNSDGQVDRLRRVERMNQKSRSTPSKGNSNRKWKQGNERSKKFTSERNLDTTEIASRDRGSEQSAGAEAGRASGNPEDRGVDQSPRIREDQRVFVTKAFQVERRGVEPPTSALRTQRSPN